MPIAKPSSPPAAQLILVIKLGALGDFVQALAPMQTLRAVYPEAQIDLLTTKPFVELAEASRLFRSIKTDTRPAFWNLAALGRLREQLRQQPYDLIVDLQTSDRSSAYRLLTFPNPPAWSGIAPLCSHPHANPNRHNMHTVERQADQLGWLGIDETASLDMSFLSLQSVRGELALPEGAVMIAPGGAPHRPDKRWPAQHYATLASRLAEHNFTPVVVGTDAEQEEANAILQACPSAISFIGKTSILELGAVAMRASAAVGNDTGPMHLIAATGRPSLVLYSHASDPALCAQRGADVTILREPSMDRLSVDAVLDVLLKALSLTSE